MATEKKHVAVYLGFAVERALIAFCEQNNLKTKKGIAFSAGINILLRKYFGISAEIDNTPPEELPIETRFNKIEPIESVRPQDSQLRKDIAALYAIGMRLIKATESGAYTPPEIAKASIKAQVPLVALIKALEEMDDTMAGNR